MALWLQWLREKIIQLPFGNIHFQLSSLIDIVLVAALFYWLYMLVRETRAIRIIYGLAILLVLWIMAQLFHLDTLNFILRFSATALAVAIPVIFQPELRAGLEKLGRTQFVTEFTVLRRSDVVELTKTIADAAEVMAHQKIGAIIVIGRKTGLREYKENGVKLDANLSAELLLSIFAPESALHDGAVVVEGNKISAAKVILPLSDNKFDFRLGTRHRAAVGITSTTDAIAIIVSEERGEISIAVDGLLESGINRENLQKIILGHLKPRQTK